jgi:hypothetical protein
MKVVHTVVAEELVVVNWVLRMFAMALEGCGKNHMKDMVVIGRRDDLPEQIHQAPSSSPSHLFPHISGLGLPTG